MDDDLKSEFEELSECVKIDHKAEIEGLKLENGFSMSQVTGPLESPLRHDSDPSFLSNSKEEEEFCLLQNKELKWQSRADIGLDMQPEVSEEIEAKALMSSASPQLNHHLQEGEQKERPLKINAFHYNEPPRLIRCFQVKLKSGNHWVFSTSIKRICFPPLKQDTAAC